MKNYQLESDAAVAGLFDSNFRNKIDVPVRNSGIKAGEAVFYNPETKEIAKTPSRTNVFLGIAMFAHLDEKSSETNCVSVLQEGIIWAKVAEAVRVSADENLEISNDGVISNVGDYAFGNVLLPFDSKTETSPSGDKIMRCIVNVKGGANLAEAV